MVAANNKTERELLREALGPVIERKLWSANVEALLPLTFNDVDIEAVMPAVLFTLRWGGRRGAGAFVQSFTPPDSLGRSRSEGVTALDIARTIQRRNNEGNVVQVGTGVQDGAAENILANLLSGLCFDNRKSQPGIDKPIQRVYPVHYFASKFDLPDNVANLRYVPELIVSALMVHGQHRSSSGDGGPTLRSIDRRMDNQFTRLLLSIYASGVEIQSNSSLDVANLGNFKERISEAKAAQIGLDQLLLVRASECLTRVPSTQQSQKAGNEREFQPKVAVTKRQNRIVERDLRDFIRFFGRDLPRADLNRSIEVLVGINVFAILLSFARTMNSWLELGDVPNDEGQLPLSVFVDCSGGQDRKIRGYAEDSFDRALSGYLSSSLAIKTYQVIEAEATVLRDPSFPVAPNVDPQELLAAAGAILNSDDPGHRTIRRIEDHRDGLRELILENGDEQSLAVTLGVSLEHPAISIARVVIEMLGKSGIEQKMVALLDAVLGSNDARGTSMLAKRNTQRPDGGRTRAYKLERSFRLPDTVLETLVHRFLIDSQRKEVLRVTVRDFIKHIGDNYGLVIDEGEIAGVPADVLRRNREYLEERLRALGLLSGVNDAENMKVLSPRFVFADGYNTLTDQD